MPEPWLLPWNRITVPHAVLDVNRGCNISCRACYNSMPAGFQSLDAIRANLDALQIRRRLDSVSIVGGEVLLHPNICEIVRLVKSRGLAVELCTNGLLLDDECLDRLTQVQTDLIFLHADSGQIRPDLPTPCTPDQLHAFWSEKTARVAAHGIDVGLALTAYGDNLPEMLDAVEFTMQSPVVNYLLVTLHRDLTPVAHVRGNLDAGMHGTFQSAPPANRSDLLNNARVLELLADKLSLHPFGCIGSNVQPDDRRWLSYLVAVSRGPDGSMSRHAIRPSLMEKVALQIFHLLKGRYPMYRRQSARQLAAQLFLNGLTGGDRKGNFRFLSAMKQPASSVAVKRLLFQCPAEVDPSGRVIHCEPCPDAVLKDGNLCPVCISDKVQNTTSTDAQSGKAGNGQDEHTQVLAMEEPAEES